MAATYEQPTDAVERVRFFDGQYLQDQDFVDEQHYQIDRQRRHQRLLHVAGIADGLAVSRGEAGVTVRVAPGTAVDSDGRTLVLAEEPGEARVVNLVDFLGRTVRLYLVFQEVESNPQATGTADFARWLEQPHLEVVEVGVAHDFTRPPVLLAQVVLNNQVVERIETGEVTYAGLRLPGPTADDPTLRAGADGTAQLAGSLSVTGNLSFGSRARQMVNLWGTGYAIGIQASTQYNRSDRNFAWYQGGAHAEGELAPGTGGKALMVLHNGNLGVGTGSAAQRLVVVGETSTTAKETENKLTTAGQVAIKGAVAQLDFVDTNGTDWAIHVNDGKLHFVREPWEHQDLVLDGKGNVGIGTASPAARLHLNGDGLVAGALSFGSQTRQMINLWSTTYGLGVQASTQYNRSDRNFAWYQGGAHAEGELAPGTGGKALMVLHNGNLGVGTGSAAQRLVVVGETSTTAKDADNKLTTAGQVAIKGAVAQLDFVDTNGTDWAIHVNDGKLHFVREPWEHQDLVLDGKGNVGIGTASPAARLHLNGDGLVAGALSFGSQTRQMINLWGTTYGLGVQASTQYNRSDRNFAWYQGGAHAEGELAPGTGGKALMVLHNGNLGVGTGSAAQRLVVVGETSTTAKDADNTLTTAGQVAIKGAVAQLDFVDTNGTDWAIHVNNNRMYFIREPWEYKDLVLDGKGMVGIGTDAPTAKLEVMGSTKINGRTASLLFEGQPGPNQVSTWSIIPEWTMAGQNLAFKHGAHATAFWIQPAGGYGQASDARLKTDVAPLAGVLDDVLRLRPSSYRFTAAGPDGPPSIGFVAQEVEEVFPELVQEHDGHLGLSYSDFSVLAIAALQEQHALITELRAQVQVLAEASGRGGERQ